MNYFSVHPYITLQNNCVYIQYFTYNETEIKPN